MAGVVPNSAARVIVCKLGRFGELRKIFDKSNATNNEHEERKTLSARRRPNPTTSPMASSPFLQRLLTMTSDQDPFNLYKEDAEDDLTASAASVLDDLLNSRPQLPIASETQIVSGADGLMLDADLRDAILGLGIGDTVRK